MSDTQVRTSPNSIYNCPSRRRPTVIGTVILVDYAGNAGVTWCPANETNTWTGVIVPSQVNIKGTWTNVERWPCPGSPTGPRTRSCWVRSLSASTTTRRPPSGDNNWWGHGNSWITTQNAIHLPRQDQICSSAAQETPAPNAGAPGINGRCGPWGLGPPANAGGYYDYLGSAHPAGFNAAMTNGSVRLLAIA